MSLVQKHEDKNENCEIDFDKNLIGFFKGPKVCGVNFESLKLERYGAGDIPLLDTA